MGEAHWQSPRGTRDLYPVDAMRRRFLTEAWRRAAIVHGFDEVDGPTFEHLDLYAVKSGEGIVSELFQAFSGKDEAEIAAVRERGAAPFALRPEFTPTLARMFVAQAGSLARPIKWFCIGPCFRAERPQRGRLREFLQWNVEQIGDGGEQADREVIACCIDLLGSLGLTSDDVTINVNNRALMVDILTSEGLADEQTPAAFALLDRAGKLSREAFERECRQLDLPHALMQVFRAHTHDAGGRPAESFEETGRVGDKAAPLVDFRRSFDKAYQDWITPDLCIVRGLAYYTGMVFEAVAKGERAVAGGGRYDNLVELFGGPPTPAVGFAMGDVVITNLLQDKGLMPPDRELMARVGTRPDAFVFSLREELDDAAMRLIGAMRHSGLHARRSYKATRNVGKLLKDAASHNVRFAIIIESDSEATVKDLDSGSQERMPIDAVGERISQR